MSGSNSFHPGVQILTELVILWDVVYNLSYLKKMPLDVLFKSIESPNRFNWTKKSNIFQN